MPSNWIYNDELDSLVCMVSMMLKMRLIDNGFSYKAFTYTRTYRDKGRL